MKNIYEDRTLLINKAILSALILRSSYATLEQETYHRWNNLMLLADSGFEILIHSPEEVLLNQLRR